MSDTLHIGSIITTPQDRDAVHMAIVPVEAAYELRPGQMVRMQDGKAVYTIDRQHSVGIVDPFLKVKVQPGQRFWLFLYPGSITSLRHDWTHPAFPASALRSATDSSTSVEWMQAFAAQNDHSYEEMIMAGRDGYLHSDDGCSVPPEFWTHWECITGERAGERLEYFSCAC